MPRVATVDNDGTYTVDNAYIDNGKACDTVDASAENAC
jgi:hypothetical protein